MYAIRPLVMLQSIALLLSVAPFAGGKKKSKHDAGLYMHGFMVNISRIPPLERYIPNSIRWTEFEKVVRLSPTSAFDLFSAIWNNQKVLIKSLRASKMRDTSSYELEKEINMLSRIEHPNIIKLLGTGNEPYRFQVVEYFEGGTLARLLNEKSTRNRQRQTDRPSNKIATKEKMLKYGVSLAKALHYLHEEFYPGVRIAHRDLKPDNVGVTSNGDVKIFDFGLADLIRKSEDENELFLLSVGDIDGKPVGTWAYAAPEVVRCEKYNHKVDVYGFSIMLYYMLVGEHPMQIFQNYTVIRQRVSIHGGWRPELGENATKKECRQWPVELKQLFADMWNDDITVRPNMSDVVNRLTAIYNNYSNWLRQKRSNSSRKSVTSNKNSVGTTIS